MLKFRPHWLLPDHKHAYFNGCSVVVGPLVDNVEVQDNRGEIHHFKTVEEAEEFMKGK